MRLPELANLLMESEVVAAMKSWGSNVGLLADYSTELAGLSLLLWQSGRFRDQDQIVLSHTIRKANGLCLCSANGLTGDLSHFSPWQSKPICVMERLPGPHIVHARLRRAHRGQEERRPPLSFCLLGGTPTL